MAKKAKTKRTKEKTITLKLNSNEYEWLKGAADYLHITPQEAAKRFVNFGIELNVICVESVLTRRRSYYVI